MIIDALLALGSKEGFRIGWKRVRHIKHGHPHAQSTLLDKVRSEAHPHTDDKYVFTINVLKCNDCGLTYLDSGLELRR